MTTGCRSPTKMAASAASKPEYPEGTEANDVFIVEGTQERYGSKRASEVYG